MSEPNAQYKEAHKWISSVFEPPGVHNTEMWTSLDGHSAEELSSFDSLYIGGGNTFHLLHLLRQSGFDRHIVDFVGAGKAVYGGSAGAIVLGRNILTAHGDHNNEALVDTRGLDLARGYAIWCHYTEEHDQQTYRYIHKYAIPVLALPERAGVGMEAERLVAWGHEPIYRFTHLRKRAVQPGEQV